MSTEVIATVAQTAPPLTKKGGLTRKLLLDSTITLLAAQGYAATTVQAVLDHSGVSRGSLLHQFKTRNHLMVAAALEAVERMFNGVSEGLEKVADPREALRQYPNVQWTVQNQEPARAFAEIQLASRWEQTLQAALRPAVHEINERIVRQVHETAEAVGHRNVDKLVIEVGALLSALQGLAVSRSLETDARRTRAILDALAAHYLACLDEFADH